MIVDFHISKLESYPYYCGAPIYTSNTVMIPYHEDSSFHTFWINKRAGNVEKAEEVYGWGRS